MNPWVPLIGFPLLPPFNSKKAGSTEDHDRKDNVQNILVPSQADWRDTLRSNARNIKIVTTPSSMGPGSNLLPLHYLKFQGER